MISDCSFQDSTNPKLLLAKPTIHKLSHDFDLQPLLSSFESSYLFHSSITFLQTYCQFQTEACTTVHISCTIVQQQKKLSIPLPLYHNM